MVMINNPHRPHGDLSHRWACQSSHLQYTSIRAGNLRGVTPDTAPPNPSMHLPNPPSSQAWKPTARKECRFAGVVRMLRIEQVAHDLLMRHFDRCNIRQLHRSRSACVSQNHRFISPIGRELGQRFGRSLVDRLLAADRKMNPAAAAWDTVRQTRRRPTTLAPADRESHVQMLPTGSRSPANSAGMPRCGQPAS